MKISKHTVTFIETWVELLDTKIGIGKFSFGIDPLFSFLPGVGALIPTIFTMILVGVAIAARAPLRIVLLMTGYMLIDLMISEVPVAGIPLDAVFHANVRCWNLLKPYVTDTIDTKNISAKFKDQPIIVEGEIVQ